MKLPDALEQAVRTLLSTNGSHHASRAVEIRPDRIEISLHEESEAQGPPVTEQAEPSAARALAAGDAPLAGLERATGVVETLGLGFHLGSAVERITLAADQGSQGTQRLREAAWLIERYCELLEQRPVGADLHATMMRLAREGDTIAGLQALASVLERAPATPVDAAGATQPAIEPPPQPEPAVMPAQPSIARELFLATARAVIVVAAIVGVVLALTVIAQLH